jgi:hypothetical protein
MPAAFEFAGVAIIEAPSSIRFALGGIDAGLEFAEGYKLDDKLSAMVASGERVWPAINVLEQLNFNFRGEFTPVG